MNYLLLKRTLYNYPLLKITNLPMKNKLSKALLLIVFAFSANVNADDSDAIKQGLLSSMSSGIASSIAEVIGGQGDTEVQFSAKENNKPEFSIMTVRPISVHPGKDAWMFSCN